ncbi:1-phosphatidylinositol 4,5-bisphosphate phosphodiesterase beta-1-like isoform X3 [Petromyzon marinus]|uniref:1-phosphatidylinositol 4,5-bisphosphate phosphodiesterase n=1 Tax=Petromyzon marinus TaxID=7757 RepID=A0AAJ7T7C4_PETMA|nr:1-phosphatidylinositol 4,5-bisphosphate phosphodiesterase beta-1-like isoform X3 [Petromyzon marinus]
MAGAQPGVHSLQLKPIQVSEDLKKGNKFLKWEEDSNTLVPVTLAVDDNGHFLYWTDMTKETESLEITSIRDTRTGKYAKMPKDTKFRDQVEGFTGVGMESRTITVVHGPDLVNISFLNFTALTESVAKVWTDELFTLATNLLAQNSSRDKFLNKAYTKLKLQSNTEDKVPVRSILRMFPTDKKKVENALMSCELPSGRNDNIPIETFTYEAFYSFVNKLCPRTDIDSIFAESGAKNKPYMTVEQFTDFINSKQRDPRLNEVLFPPMKTHQVQALIDKFESTNLAKKGQISVLGFLRYLNGEENGIVPPEKLDLNEDMTQPLSHYFINSSHNTYLTGGQLKGNSSVEMYRQSLLAGCRCVELDCWKGRTADEDPIITHGFTMTTEIPFKEVIDAIAETAFKTSPYPVVLSFENHVDSPKQQAKMAEYCRLMFGDALLVDVLDKYPLESGVPLPSPEELKGKILIKNKKKKISKADTARKKLEVTNSNTPSESSIGDVPASTGVEPADNSQAQATPNGTERVAKNTDWQKSTMFKKSLGNSGDEDVGSDDEDYNEEELKKANTDEGTASIEAGASEEMSNLVNYVQPIKFDSFEDAKKRNRNYEMSSFVESKGMEQLTKCPVEFVEYNKTQLSRIYPKGTRVDSSNYMPQVFWNAGCQMVALNYQTLDLAMQLNMGIFEYNCRSGYLLKPEFMRRADKQFDPFTQDIIDGVIANTISVKVISGQFLSDRKVSTYVEVDMFGLPVDTKRKYKTRTSKDNNSINPVWEEDPFVFDKVVLPSLASLRIGVFEEGGKFIGHRILPVSAIRPGFHHICLRNESNQPLSLPAIFVFIQVKDYVPVAFENFISGLSNPIMYQGLMEQRAKQLESLTMDEDQVDSQAAPQAPQTPQRPSPGPRPDPVAAPRDRHRASITNPPDLLGLGLSPKVDKRCSIDEHFQADVRLASLDDLKCNKLFNKMSKRHMKELQDLQKKNGKKAADLIKEQSSQLSEMQSGMLKKRASFERQLFKGRSVDCKEPYVDSELSRSLTEMRKKQQDDLVLLRQDHYAQELRKRGQHNAQIYEKLLELAQESYASLQKKLKDVCEKEEKDTRKQMDTVRQEQLENASKDVKDKKELERQKNQINTMHIQDTVVKVKTLQDSQEKRKERIAKTYEQLLKQIKDEEQMQLKSLQIKYEEKLKRLPTEIKDYVEGGMKGRLPQEPEFFFRTNSRSSFEEFGFSVSVDCDDDSVVTQL